MDKTHASSSIAVPSRSSIRHRSGTFSPALNQRRRDSLANSASSTRLHARTHGDLTVQVEDADDEKSKPTILLVQRSPAGLGLSSGLLPPRSPTLPFHNGTVSKGTLARARLAEFATLPSLGKHDASPVVQDEEAYTSGVAAFSPIPLTPCPLPDAPPLKSLDLPSSTSNRSLKVPLPQYNAPPASSSLSQRLLSWRKPKPKHTYTNDDHSQIDFQQWAYPQQTKPPSTSSTVRQSNTASSTIRYKRPLAPTTPTHNKLTKKFPISASVRKLSALGRGKVGDHALAIVLLDESAGMGVDGVGRWTLHKWCLFLSVWTVCGYGATGLVCAVLTWFTAWPHADVMYVADYDVLVLITLASSLTLLTFLFGLTGTLLNSRPILALYALLLWPALVAILAIGYASYKRAAYSLDRKLNMAWSEWYTPLGRSIVQDSLRCCGYYSPLHDAVASSACYARSMLPGCKGPLLRFERDQLARVWAAAFGVVPIHIANIFVSLLCANHVTRRFGKGIVPRQYRLTSADVMADEQRLSSIIEEKGGIARPTLARAPSSSMFREDKQSKKYDSLPPALRPGIP